MATEKRKANRQWGPHAYDRLTSADISPDELLTILRISLHERHMDRRDRESLFRAIRENKAMDLLLLERPTLSEEIKALKESEYLE